MADLTVLELTSSLYCLRLADDRAHLLNSYVWLEPHGVTLIDCGWPDSAHLVERGLAQLGHSTTSVERLVLTHFHEDHAGSADEVTRWADLEVIAGRADAPFITGEQTGPVPDSPCPKETFTRTTVGCPQRLRVGSIGQWVRETSCLLQAAPTSSRPPCTLQAVSGCTCLTPGPC